MPGSTKLKMGVFKRAEEAYKRKDPKPIGDTLPAILNKLGVDADFTGGAVFSRWKSIVGNQIAHNARPKHITNGTLIVAVKNSAWLMELNTFHKKTILNKIKKTINTETITDIYFMLSAEEA